MPPNKQGTLVPIQRDARELSASAPRRVFLGDHPTAGAGHYVFVDTRSEATAWLKEVSPGVLKFDDDPANDDWPPVLVSTSPNVIIL